MKKRIALLGITSLLIFGCSGNEAFDNSASNVLDVSTSQSKLEKSVKPFIQITLDIGRKSRKCLGFGVCRASVKIGAERRSFVGNVKIINPNKFILYVDEENMSKIVNGYGEQHLILEEDFTLDYEEIVTLNLAENFTIGEGIYQFIQDPETSLYWVEISNNN